MRLLIICILFAISLNTNAQQKLFVKVTGSESKTPVPSSIVIKGTSMGFTTDTSGLVNISFPLKGNYILITSSVGFEEKQTSITIPYIYDTLFIELENGEHEMEEVIVQSTRTSRTIANVPTRVETIEF